MRIAVFGCSWSHHSFKKLDGMKESDGTLTFQSMFQKINIVCDNFSLLAGSNQDMLSKLSTVDIDAYDKIIIFQTDPLRDLYNRHHMRLEPIQSQFRDCANIDQLSERLLSLFYSRLYPYQNKLLLVGGLSRLHFPLIEDKIDTIDKSWTELVIDGYRDCYYEWTDVTDLIIDQYAESFGWSQVDDIKFSAKKQILSKNHAWQISEHFGWCHPGDGAYLKMFETICDRLNISC